MIIYEAYNKQNGKSYFGLTTKTLNRRRKQHLNSAKRGVEGYFMSALRKYDEEDFEWSEILRCKSLEKLYELEKMVISLFEWDKTYNCSLGGEHSAYGMKHTEETKRICGEYAKRRWDGKRATDIHPPWVFNVCSYRVAKKFGVPKTTWYRQRKTV